jgi:CHAT domain-containing protein
VRAARLDGRGLEAEVRALREAVGQASGEAWRGPARRLYDRLLAPVPGALDRPRLVIVPHGPLHYLPWAALTDGRQTLAERAAPTFLPSAGVLRFLAARTAAPARTMLILGNPDLGDKAFDLPGAQAEARAIRGIWPDSTVLLRKAATKSALTRAGGLFRIIHVAAHGEFVADRPLDSRILLSPEGEDDGRLTAGDLYGLRLAADLVTLSACETGMGQVLSGDDVVGLTRGFLYAGAASIVASLWPVSDAETQFLMTGFYRNLKSLPKAEALRRAQLETMRRFPHPFFWSAFQLTGQGR